MDELHSDFGLLLIQNYRVVVLRYLLTKALSKLKKKQAKIPVKFIVSGAEEIF